MEQHLYANWRYEVGLSPISDRSADHPALAWNSDTHVHAKTYFERLAQRPSILRVIEEARPYFQFYPFQDAIPQRFR